jgi:hypothetical protein
LTLLNIRKSCKEPLPGGIPQRLSKKDSRQKKPETIWPRFPSMAAG